MGGHLTTVFGPTRPGQNSDEEGSGYLIGDGVVLTAGHIVFEWNRRLGVDLDIIEDEPSFLDYRGYEALYRGTVQWINALDPDQPASIYESNRILEASIIAADSVLIGQGGNVTSRHDGLVTFMQPTDLNNVATSVTGSRIFREGNTTSRVEGTISAVNTDGGFRFSKGSQQGDSGGAYLLNVGGREYVIGTQAGNSNPSNLAVGTYFSYANWHAINDYLARTQSSDVTSSEPVNMVVGSTQGDVIVGSFRADRLFGRDGNDTINDGDAPGDTVWANDTLVGGLGDDTFQAGAGDDIIWGGDLDATSGVGDGRDIVRYSDSHGPVTVTFTGTGPAPGVVLASADIGTDTLHFIDEIVLTTADDSFSFAGALPAGYRLKIDANGGQIDGRIDLTAANGAIVATRTATGFRLTSPGSDGLIELSGFDPPTSAAASGFNPANALFPGWTEVVPPHTKILGSDTVMTTFVGFGGVRTATAVVFVAGAAGGDFTLTAGDSAIGREGVRDIFRVTTTAPAELTPNQQIEYLKDNKVSISQIGAEDEVFVNGVRFDGNRVSSSLAPTLSVPTGGSDTYSSLSFVRLTGDSSYGTIYPDAHYAQVGVDPVNGPYGTYVYNAADRVRDVSYAPVEDFSGNLTTKAVLSFLSRGTSGVTGKNHLAIGNDYYELAPITTADEMLSVILDGFQDGNAGIGLQNDSLAHLGRPDRREEGLFGGSLMLTRLEYQGIHRTGVYVGEAYDVDGISDGLSSGGGPMVDSGDARFNMGDYGHYEGQSSIALRPRLYASPEGGTLTGNDRADLIFGGIGTDVLNGLEGDDTLYGEAGNDTLDGGAGDDLLDGGAGDDFLISGSGRDRLIGGDGNDAFLFGASFDYEDVVDGGAGANDQFAVQGDYADRHTVQLGNVTNVEVVGLLSGADTRFGETGANRYSYTVKTYDANVAVGRQFMIDANNLRVGENLRFEGSDELDGRFFVRAGEGDDVIEGGAGDDRLEGSLGADALQGNGGNDYVIGEDGNDQVFGGDGDDILGGDEGDDRVEGGDGNDYVYGSGGRDYLIGQAGNDHVFGGDDDDILGGDEGDDRVEGGNGNDYVYGSGGRDYLIGQAGNDHVFGGDDDDILGGDAGDDRVEGGNDHVYGSGGRDYLIGEAGNDHVFGGDDDDVLGGDDGDDRLEGGGGNDFLYGGAGADVLIGGTGADMFVFMTAGGSANRDAVEDFSSGTDRLDISLIDANAANASGNDAFVFIGSAAFGGIAGQLRAFQDGNAWRVEGDVDGDGVADLIIGVNGPAPLTAADFIL